MTLEPQSSALVAQSSTPQPAVESDLRMFCRLHVGSGVYGIDTRRIREVMSARAVQPVPLSPEFIAGIVPYRGEVLTSVSLRALLGLPPRETHSSSILVLDDDEERENFALLVDSVHGVVTVPRSLREPNPPTLDQWAQRLFDGSYPLPNGLLIHIATDHLRPSHISAWRQPTGTSLRQPIAPGDTSCAP